jgi:hypothetical protein
LQGQGRLQSACGDTYEGEWVAGKRHGQGLLTLANGDVYGELRGREREGAFTAASSLLIYLVLLCCAEGSWQQGSKHGQGRFQWADGSCYEGAWEQDGMRGQGCFLFANKDSYTGAWLDSMRHGECLTLPPNSATYSTAATAMLPLLCVCVCVLQARVCTD